VATGQYYTCALRSDGRIICFGRDTEGQTDVPVGTYRAISGSDSDTCAIRTDGTLACWGYHYRSSPPYYYPQGTYESVSVGMTYNCALDAGTPTCWGGVIIPIPSATFASIATTNWSACGIRPDGSVTCWDSFMLPDYGQTTPPPGTFGALSLNGVTTCGVATPGGALACWGYDSFGVPPPSGSFKAISINQHDACALEADGSIRCWGHDSILTAPPAGGGFEALSLASEHACAIRSGALYCWGDNSDGQLTPPSY